MKAVIPTYQFTVTLPIYTGFYITCDSTLITCDQGYTCDNSLGAIPVYKQSYTLDALLFLSCDNTYITSDNLITSDNG